MNQVLYPLEQGGMVAHQYRDNASHRLIVRFSGAVQEIKSEWYGYQQPAEFAGFIAFTDYYGERVLAVQELQRQPAEELKPEPKPRFTRAERGFAKRCANRMLTQERREFPSASNPDVTYTTRIMLDGKVMCDCRGWTIKKQGQPRWCKHTRELVGTRPTWTNGEFLYVGGSAPLAASTGA